MRPLELTFQAFGSYPGKESVDFRALSQRGLFVVAGATGAGKTSVFDAMVYALFGVLPGARSSEGRERSDFAEPTTETFVEFEFQVQGGRYRVRRTPAQLRPKHRGGGFTTQQAQATLVRCIDDATEGGQSGAKQVSRACEDLDRSRCGRAPEGCSPSSRRVHEVSHCEGQRPRRPLAGAI